MVEYQKPAYLNPAPKNDLGYFVQVCDDPRDAFSPSELLAIINGPIKAMEPKLQKELAKPIMVYRLNDKQGFAVETPNDIRAN